jgi:hypothetical protein
MANKGVIEWVSTKDELPETKERKFGPETKYSKKVLVRWRFKESGTKWRYSFAIFYNTRKGICGPWWAIEGVQGPVQVSHFAYIKKPIINK